MLLTFAVFTDAVTLSSVVSLDDQVRFKELFYSAMPFVDLETAYHAVRSLKLMKAEVPPTQVRNLLFINPTLETLTDLDFLDFPVERKRIWKWV